MPSIPSPLHPYITLLRLDKPTGIWLLLFPAWWAIALAAPQGALPNLIIMGLFFVGAVCMRGAGCIVNDVFDRELDAQVERTKNRPLASGAVKPRDALVLAAMLTLIGLLIAASMNRFSILVAALALPLIILYPLMKRITFWPQAFLGITFNWGALLGTAAVTGEITWGAVLLYLSCIFWTLGYDTIYAFQDVRDDEKAGIKSTARLFGADAKKAVRVFYLLFWLGLLITGFAAQMNSVFFIMLVLLALELKSHVDLWDIESPQSSLAMFKASEQVGWLVLAAIILGRLF